MKALKPVILIAIVSGSGCATIPALEEVRASGGSVSGARQRNPEAWNEMLKHYGQPKDIVAAGNSSLEAEEPCGQGIRTFNADLALVPKIIDEGLNSFRYLAVYTGQQRGISPNLLSSLNLPFINGKRVNDWVNLEAVYGDLRAQLAVPIQEFYKNCGGKETVDARNPNIAIAAQKLGIGAPPPQQKGNKQQPSPPAVVSTPALDAAPPQIAAPIAAPTAPVPPPPTSVSAPPPPTPTVPTTPTQTTTTAPPAAAPAPQ